MLPFLVNKDVYNEIRKLLALSFPGASSEICKIFGLDAFSTALRDPVLRVRVFDQNPKNLDKAVSIGSRVEAYSSLVPDGDGPTDEAGRRKVRGITAAPADHENRRLKQLEDDLADQRRQVQQLKADNDYWRTRAETAVTMPSAWPAPSTDATWLAPPSPAVGMPWNTGPAPPPPPMMTAASPGFAPQRPPVSRRGHHGRRRGRALVNRDQCRICYQPGHWSYNCPQQQSLDPDNANVCGVSSPSQSSSVTYTYMNVILNRIKTVALIHSGSEKNLIPSRLVQGVSLKPCHTELFAANGSQINVLGSVCLNVVVNGLFLPTELLVTDEINDVIFGYSFLCENACQWNFDIAMLMVRGTPVRLLKRSSVQYSSVHRIYVKETTDVPTGVTMYPSDCLPELGTLFLGEIG